MKESKLGIPLVQDTSESQQVATSVAKNYRLNIENHELPQRHVVGRQKRLDES